MTGGAGNDTYVVDSAGDVVIEAVGGGTDTSTSSPAVSYTLACQSREPDVPERDPEPGYNRCVTGTGNTVDNIIIGGAGNDMLNGSGGGNDTLKGGAGQRHSNRR